MTEERAVRIRRIRDNCTKIITHGRGSYTIRLKLDHQSFQLQESGFYESRKHAEWTANQLAIALNRFKHGD